MLFVSEEANEGRREAACGKKPRLIRAEHKTESCSLFGNNGEGKSSEYETGMAFISQSEDRIEECCTHLIRMEKSHFLRQ